MDLKKGSQKTKDGRSVWEFAAIEPGAGARFLINVALLRLDSEGRDTHGNPWIIENDEALKMLNEIVSEARNLLGWKAGTIPLDHPEYEKS